MIKTAIFGGTFDPVHSEHINIAKACVEELQVNKIVIVPTFNPPHKGSAGAGFKHRVNMLKLAFADFPCEVIISEIENNEGTQKNYSADNLPKLKQQYGDFYYVIGGDSLLNFENWYNPHFIAQNFKIVVFNRKGYAEVSNKTRELNAKWDSQIRVMNYVGKEVDSHILRIKLNLNLYTKGLTPEVEKYIVENKLYHNYDEYLFKLPSYLSSARLEHSKHTALMATYLNTRCCLDLSYDKVIIAGLLHDIGKKYDYIDNAIGIFDFPADSAGSAVQHQFIGAILAEKDFKITDKDILNAIRYHTTGHADMSTIEKLIYAADMVSGERLFKSAENLRQELYKDFEKGFKLCLLHSYKYLMDNKRSIYPLTIQAINFYKEQK